MPQKNIFYLIVFLFLFLFLDSIIGSIKFTQPSLPDTAITKSMVATNTTTNLIAVIKDPSNFFKDAIISYKWKINEEPLDNTLNLVNYNFTKSKMNEIVVIVNVNLSQLSFQKSGVFNQNLTSKEAVENITAIGTTWLPRNQDLKVNLNFIKGSPPFWYCYSIVSVNSSQNSSDYPNCDTINQTSFQVTRYFGSPGSYNLLLKSGNDVSKFEKKWEIHIFDSK